MFQFSTYMFLLKAMVARLRVHNNTAAPTNMAAREQYRYDKYTAITQ
uniref:Uncharacterized protein n=2 Tax=Setaria TaxID=4554 RepID=K3ZBU8_SETIT